MGSPPSTCAASRCKCSIHAAYLLTYVPFACQRFLKATKQMSHAKMPLLYLVIPYMDSLTTSLDEFHANTCLNLAVCIAAGHGRVIVDNFYGLTDDSHIFRIAMHMYSYSHLLCYLMSLLVVLHPRYKTMYFCHNQWPPTWIDAPLDLVQAEWQEHYKPSPTNAMASSPNVVCVTVMFDYVAVDCVIVNIIFCRNRDFR